MRRFSPSQLRTGALLGLLVVAFGVLAYVNRPIKRLTPLEVDAQAELDVAYADEHPQQRIDIYLPPDHDYPGSDTSIPAIIWIHGGGWVGGDKGDSLPVWEWTDQGFAVISVNYRYAEAPHSVADAVDDAVTAVTFVSDNADRWSIDPERLGVYGFSAGGHLTAMVGHNNLPVAAVVLAGAPTDFRPLLDPNVDFFNGLEGQGVVEFSEGVLGCSVPNCEDAAVAVSPAALDAGAPPMLIVHGRLDGIVHVSQASLLYDHLTAQGADVELVIVEDEGHSSLLEHGPAEFLREHLGAG